MNLRPSVLVLTAVLAASAAFAQTPQPSDEHKHWVEVAHKYETAPLDPAANLEAEAAVKQITEAADFHIVRCDSFFKELSASPYAYHAEILRLYILGAATYQVDANKTDSEGTNLYAFHSILKGYAAILRQHPAAKDEKLDDIARQDADGKLPQLIESKGCS